MRKIIVILLISLFSCNSNPSEFPIRRDRGLPTVQVTINGKKVEMIMDTGGAITVIDDDYLKKLGITEYEEGKEITGYGGIKNVNITSQTEIKMGNKAMYGDVFVTDLDYITKGIDIGGILGIEHLASGNANIDLMTNTISLK